MTAHAPATPFPAKGKIRARQWPMTVEQALFAAQRAGYCPTSHSRTSRAHVQRAWNAAATIKPVPGGVVIAPAWTRAQILMVLIVLFLLWAGVCAL